MEQVPQNGIFWGAQSSAKQDWVNESPAYQKGGVRIAQVTDGLNQYAYDRGTIYRSRILKR